MQVLSFSKLLTPKCFQESFSVINVDALMKTLSNLSFSLLKDLDVPAKSLQSEQQDLPVQVCVFAIKSFGNVHNKNQWKNITALLHEAFDSTGGHTFHFIIFLDHDTVE